jgi:hypothetical protein
VHRRHIAIIDTRKSRWWFANRYKLPEQSIPVDHYSVSLSSLIKVSRNHVSNHSGNQLDLAAIIGELQNTSFSPTSHLTGHKQQASSSVS